MTYDDGTLVRPRPGVLAEKVGDELVMLDSEAEIYHGLNDSGAFIWHAFADGHTLVDVVAMIVRDYEVDDTAARTAVESLVSDLDDKGLVELGVSSS